MKKLKWDYTEGERRHGGQEDWNQTLVTKINQITNFEESSLTIPLKFKDIIESLFYYNPETEKIADKYKVEFVDTKRNFIFVNIDNSIEILNHHNQPTINDFKIDGHVECELPDRLDDK